MDAQAGDAFGTALNYMLNPDRFEESPIRAIGHRGRMAFLCLPCFIPDYSRPENLEQALALQKEDGLQPILKKGLRIRAT